MIHFQRIFTPINSEESAVVSGGNWLVTLNPIDYSYTLKNVADGIVYQYNSYGDLGSLIGSIGVRNIAIEFLDNPSIKEF